MPQPALELAHPRAARRSPAHAPLLTRLWWSYQRYALGLAAGAVVIAAASITAAALWSWWWALGCIISLKIFSFAGSIWGHYLRKIELTYLALTAIEDNTFSPDVLKNYCGDPCYRVVADEILRYTGRNAVERREVIRAHRTTLTLERAEVVVMDHTLPAEQHNPLTAAGSSLPARFSVRFEQPPQPPPSSERVDTHGHP